MLYRLVRRIVGFALRLFYRLEVRGLPLDTGGPVIFVGNHPNSLIDPALIFVVTDRPVTFLAKAPLFSMPGIGWILKGLDALPVYRRQDDPRPHQMARNEGTLSAAAEALSRGRAIMLFPEGRSHSEPGLGEIKTGASRIALQAASSGAPVRIVPVGLTYAEKNRFRSEVLVEVGRPIEVQPFLHDPEAVRTLTDAVEASLRAVTLDLEKWEDLPLIETAEALYSLRLGEAPRDPDRLRRFARGLEILRHEQPDRFRVLRDDVASFKRRLDLVRARPEDLSLAYRPGVVMPFVLKNLAALVLGLPLFALGVVLFAIPFQIPRIVNRALRRSLDQQATVKLVCALLLTPAWWSLLAWSSWTRLGTGWGVATLAGVLPLALFTRYFYERRRSALHDIRMFLVLGGRARLKVLLVAEGEKLAAEVDAVAAELRPRVVS